jgi:hypothetical protein
MIAARRSTTAYSTDPVAQSVRQFNSTSVCSQQRSEAAPGATAPLDLERLYPSIFAPAAAPAPAGGFAAAAGALSVTAAAFAVLVAAVHH